MVFYEIAICHCLFDFAWEGRSCSSRWAGCCESACASWTCNDRSCALNIYYIIDRQASGSPIVIESNCFVSPMKIVGIFGCCNGATNAVLKKVTAQLERQWTLCCSELLLVLVDVDLSRCLLPGSERQTCKTQRCRLDKPSSFVYYNERWYERFWFILNVVSYCHYSYSSSDATIIEGEMLQWVQWLEITHGIVKLVWSLSGLIYCSANGSRVLNNSVLLKWSLQTLASSIEFRQSAVIQLRVLAQRDEVGWLSHPFPPHLRKQWIRGIALFVQ